MSLKPSAENLRKYLNIERDRLNLTLDELLPGVDEKPSSLHSAIRHSVFAGGKKLRPILLKTVASGFDYNEDLIYPAGAAIEMIHTYSLIHDDLPALDNDDLRRGKPTCHVQYGEAMAILAGDALNTAAFGVLASLPYPKNLLSAGLQVVKELSDYSGTGGMIRGQAADIMADNKNINAEELDFIQMNKTAALIICSLRCGALLSSADGESLYKITKLGALIGIAFQIKDDILDITSTPEELGKTTGKDVAQNKATYPTVHGMKKAEDDLIRMSREAMEIAGEFDKNIPWLYYIVEYLLKRRS